MSSSNSFQRPEDDPERKKKDLKLAFISGFSVIIVIAIAVACWIFLL